MTATDNANELHVPVYRYYLTDLLSGRIQAEVPFSNVSYGRAVKGAGSFSGKLPVLDNEASKSWDLYKSTMPGKTGLYVLRDEECVWGGIIWSREYSANDKTLTVSGNEFTSYFHHRRIWKSWNHAYGATVTNEGGVITVTYDDAGEPVTKGSSVELQWNDMTDMASLKYGGFYEVDEMGDDDDSFTIANGGATASILAVERDGDWITYYTNGKHGFNTGDEIVITMDAGQGVDSFSGTYTIEAPNGSTSSYFIVPNETSKGDLSKRSVTGTGLRALPESTWEGVTVAVRSDTYDFIRALVQLVFKDFDSLDYPETMTEPGIVYEVPVTSKTIKDGIATLTTGTDHNLIEGQSFSLFSIGKELNGDHVVFSTPTSNVVQFRSGGDVNTTQLVSSEKYLTKRRAADQVATITTDGDHGFLPGDTVFIEPGFDVDLQGAAYGGSHLITETPKANTFRYKISATTSLDEVTIPNPTATVSGKPAQQITHRSLDSHGVAHITTRKPHGFSATQRVTINDLDVVVPVTQKSFDAKTGFAIIETGVAHSLMAGDHIEVAGMQDKTTIVATETTSSTATLYTKSAHNIRKGQTVTVDGFMDRYTLDSRGVSVVNGNKTVTLSTKRAHSLNVGDDITVTNAWEYEGLATKRIAANVATIVTATPTLIRANDSITVFGVRDKYNIGSKSSTKGTAFIITERQHNYQIGQTIHIADVGSPFDGDHKITRTTDTRVYFTIKSKSYHPPTTSKRGTVSGLSGAFNGTFTVTSVSEDGKTIKYAVTANDINTTSATEGKVKSLSIINGRYEIASINNSLHQFTYELADDEQNVPNQNFTEILVSPKKDTPKPMVSVDSILNGDHMVTRADTRDFTVGVAVRSPYSKTNHNGYVLSKSVFSGGHEITSTTNTTLQFQMTTPNGNNIFETAVNTKAHIRATDIFNLTNQPILSVGDDGITFTYQVPRMADNTGEDKNHPSVAGADVLGWGVATKDPILLTRTFGPYPNNADIGIKFSTAAYSGANITPKPYRGHEMTNVGEALDAYSDSIDGFEYRIDCEYDEETDKFTRTFVLLPINFPDPPPQGEASLPSRFGADKLIFEFPGNISTVSMTESAENAANRFFAIGDNGQSDDIAQPFSVATASEMLSGEGNFDKWPLLDDDEKIKGITSREVLYAYAKRYLSEGRPPGINVTIDVNGSLAPEVGSYQPGDWCSLIIDDEFIRQRLQSDLEPRNTVLVRKIDSIKVDVPDGTAAPEKVTLELVTEREVDTVGE